MQNKANKCFPFFWIFYYQNVYPFSLLFRQCTNGYYKCPYRPPYGDFPSCVLGRKGPGCSQPDVQPCSGEVWFEICFKHLFRDVNDYLENEDMIDHHSHIHNLPFSAVEIYDLSYIYLCDYL